MVELSLITSHFCNKNIWWESLGVGLESYFISSLLDSGEPCNVQVWQRTRILLYRLFSWFQEKYVREVDSQKVNMLLVNKADLLTQKQR